MNHWLINQRKYIQLFTVLAAYCTIKLVRKNCYHYSLFPTQLLIPNKIDSHRKDKGNLEKRRRWIYPNR